MKKLNKLFGILIAVLGVGSLSAQTDVTSTYLTNADFEGNYSTFWTGSERAIFQPEGWTVVRTNGNDNDMSILCSTDVANGSFSAWTINDEGTRGKQTYWTRLRWGGQVWNWNGTTGKPTDLQLQQEMMQLPEGVYRLSADLLSYAHGTEANNHTYLIATNTTTNRSVSVEPTINHEKSDNNWENKSVLIPSSGTTNYRVTLQCLQNWQGSGEYISGFDNVRLEKIVVSSENPVDLTAFVGTAQGDWTGAGGTYSNCVEHFIWGGTATGEYLSQIVTDLPMGLYEVVMYCASSSTSSRDNGGATPVDEGDTRYVTLSANNSSVGIPSYNRTGIDGDIPTYTLTNVKVTDGTLKLLVNINEANPNWIVANIKSLTYLGPDLSTYKEALSEALTKANNFDKTSIPTAMASQLESAISNGENAEQTMEALQQATEQLNLILNVAENSQALYTDLKNLITQCNTYVSDSYSNVQDEAQRTTFTTAITTANTNGNKATTVAELTEAYNTLETARQTFVLVAYPTSGNSFDMTFKITNPSFETGDLTGWTIVQPSSDTGVKPNSNATYATTGVDGNYLFNTYWQGVPIKQTLADLPTGTYTLTVAVASDGSTVYLTADDEHSEGLTVTDKTVFVDTSIEFLCTDGETTIGVVGGADGDAAAHKEFTEDGYWWYKADNFRLVRSFDASTLQSSLTALKNTAATLLTQPMEPSKESALQTAYNNADATSDNPFDLGDWSLALEKAIAEAQSSANDYAKIQEYIDKTKVFVDASEVATYQTKHDNCEYTSADVETVRRELNVIRFNAASDVFTNKVEVKDWTGDLANGIRSDQHWSGNTQSYYDANSWVSNFVGLKHTLSTTVTLPNGTYVLKAAGRSSAEATLRLTIKDGDTVLENVEYTGKGDTGYGIDTSGTANFSDEGTYANNDAGRGWEWEFAKFELDAETTVTLHVEVDYNDIQNRFGSFSDITLWMDDATYVTVYGKELDAPLAEAKALVNTLPMGTDENTALANAIAYGEGELSGPTELNKAVADLKTAVANANTWRNTYYIEKDKLVAALERFEADYNDAQNGALDYMCKTRWTTVITEAQEAAVAKDDRTSHTGLTTATEELIAALDAATVSIGEYADLKTAIETAEPLYNGGNWGDQPFQRPTSAKESLNTTTAQATYDAATADGEAVTSLTETLNNGINVTLNAPEEGQRFYIKVATEGHSKLGNAVLATLGTTGDNNPTGYGFNANNAVKGHLNQAFIFTQVEGNLYNISIERAEGTVYLTYGSLNGSAAGWKNQQIQATTDAAKKGEFKIEATAKDGVLKIFNTVDNNYLDCQDGGSIYTDTGISAEEFNFVLASETNITLKLSSAGWATLILPFDAELPEGVKAWSCSEANGNELDLVEAGSIVANTPYLMNGYESTHTFSGYGLADKDSYTAGLFTGTYVDYKTTANSNTYVLQNKDGEVAFYLVGESAQPTVKSYRIYMTYEAAAGAPMFRLGRGTTAIEGSELDAQGSVLIYDLMGRKVNTMEKGNMYIVNGRKVVIR